MNFRLGWIELRLEIKILRSSSELVHTIKMSSIYLVKTSGLIGTELKTFLIFWTCKYLRWLGRKLLPWQCLKDQVGEGEIVVVHV